MATHQQPPPTYPPPQPARRRRKWPWLALAAAVIVVIAVSASRGAQGGSGGAGGGTASDTDTITYQVTSDASHVSVTWATWTGGSLGESQDQSATPPWVKTVTAQSSWVHSFTLVAQENPAALDGGTDGTSISCSIEVNGKTVARQTSTGQYATVTCAAS